MLFQYMMEELPSRRVGKDASKEDIVEIVYNSSRAAPHTVFVCLVGANFDGHSFAQDAYGRGCRVFIAERELNLPRDASVSIVKSSRLALAVLSAAFFGHPERELKLVGITGTKGKTTTAVMITDIMLSIGENAGYIGSNGVNFAGRHYETGNTTPESHEIFRFLREMVDCGVRVAVLEVSSQALYKSRVYGLRFDIAIFTNLAPDHIGPGEHPTFEHYRDSKAELFEKYGCTSVIYNLSDPGYRHMLANCTCENRVSFGGTPDADFYADRISISREDGVLGTTFELHALDCAISVSLSMPGRFNVANATAAIAASILLVRKYGLAPSHANDPDFSLLAVISSAISSIAVKGRFEVVHVLPDRHFVIDYAHNGYSLEVVLEVLREYAPKRLVCLFGSVGNRTFGRRAELGRVASRMCDACIVTSDNPNTEDPMQIIEEICEAFVPNGCAPVKIPDREVAIRYAVERSLPGDIVLLAGKGHENYQLIRGKKLPFSERELIEKYAPSARFPAPSAAE